MGEYAKYGFDQQGWYGMFVACGIWCLADVSSVRPSSEQTGLTLETSAKHHIPQATNIPYQPCWSNPYSSSKLIVLVALMQNCKMVNATSNFTAVVLTENDITGVVLERTKPAKLRRRSLSSLDLMVWAPLWIRCIGWRIISMKI